MKGTKSIKIGGEFEINPISLSGLSKFIPDIKNCLYASGSIALMAILNFIGKRNKKIIYIPFYICKSVFNACEKSGFVTRFYELDTQFLFPFNEIDKIERNATLLFVNYFGFIDASDIISKVKANRPDIITIYDNVQSYWTYKNTPADFSFTSLRKHIATPDGALIDSKDPDFYNYSNLDENNFYWAKLTASLLKYEQINNEVYLNLFEEGENQLYNANNITKASIFGNYFYKNADWNKIKERRKLNYRKVYEIGYNEGIEFLFSYKEGIIPLNVPILINKRDNIRRMLFDMNIFLPVHWPPEDFNKNSKNINALINNELSLIIDQRYTVKQIEFQMKKLLSVLEI